jgi:hypothetical protein
LTAKFNPVQAMAQFNLAHAPTSFKLTAMRSMKEKNPCKSWDIDFAWHTVARRVPFIPGASPGVFEYGATECPRLPVTQIANTSQPRPHRRGMLLIYCSIMLRYKSESIIMVT